MLHDRSFEKALRESLARRSQISNQLELARAKGQQAYRDLYKYREQRMRNINTEISKYRNI